jgi:hypothetical protein
VKWCEQTCAAEDEQASDGIAKAGVLYYFVVYAKSLIQAQLFARQNTVHMPLLVYQGAEQTPHTPQHTQKIVFVLHPSLTVASV